MLVKQSATVLDEVRSADIFLMLGLGEQHGKAAIEWMVDNINVDFSVVEERLKKQVKSFEDGKKTEFPGKLGRRMAYRKKLGVYRFLQYQVFRQLMIDLFLKFHWGSEIYVAKVSAVGLKNNRTVRYECSIVGQKEYYITGKIAAFVARNIYSKKYQPGVFHMEELFQPMELIDDLGGLVTFDERYSDNYK